MAFTPDGKNLITNGWDGASMWDTGSGRFLQRFGADFGKPPVGPVSVSADGKLVAAGGEVGFVYEVASGRRVFGFSRQDKSVTPSLSPSGKFLAAYYSSDFTIDLYDGQTGQFQRSFGAGRAEPGTIYPQVNAAVFTPDDKILISAGGDGIIRFWEVRTGKELQQLISVTPEVTNLVLSHDGSILASVGLKKIKEGKGITHYFTDDRVSLWDVSSKKKLRDIPVPQKSSNATYPQGPQSITFGPDGKTLWTGGLDGVLTLWDVATGNEVRRFMDHRMGLRAITIAPGGKVFAVADGMAVRIRELPSGRDLVSTGGHRSAVTVMAVSPDGRQVATGSPDDTICLWDPATGKERPLAQKVDIRNLVYSRDARVLFSAAYQVLQAWDLAIAKELWRFEDKEAIGAALILSPDGKTLASAGGRSSTILLIDAKTGKEIRKLLAPRFSVDAIAFSPKGENLLVCSGHQNLDRWDAATGKHIDRFDIVGSFVRHVSLSSDGRLLGFASRDLKMHLQVVRVIDVSTRREICRFPKRRESTPVMPVTMAFSPDGRTLAWSGQNDSVHVVEVATGQERCQFSGHKETIYSLAFSPDGKFLVSGSGDTTALVWDLTGRLAAEKDKDRPLTDSELPSCWQQLQGEDTAEAYKAMQKLMAYPAQSVPYLGKQVNPAAAVNPARLAQLIVDLDSNHFAVREKATEELEKLGELAQPALEKTLASNPSPEVKRRVEPLLEKLRAPITSGPKLQTLRAIEVLEHIATPEAQDVLQTLAKGAPEALITREAKASLDRLRKLASHTP